MLRLVYTCTLFVSAALLFVVQPMIGKMVLPLLGGTPAVWITCMVFFQAMLLAGYLYAHLTSSWLGSRRQAAIHLAMLALPLAALPFMRLPLQLARGTLTSPTLTSWLGSIPTEGNPTLWLLGLLLLCIGLPFFAVSTSAPLLQKWFASTGHPDAVDPYFLYGASNLGSMLALLGYPVVVEPYLHLPTQTIAWSIGYGVLLIMTALCAVCLWRTKPPIDDPVAALKERAHADEVSSANGSPITVWTRAYWVALAFVPSSLLLGVTTYMSTDLAAIPLLWVVPLALYLLTFILVFSRRTWLPADLLIWLLPALMVAQLLVIVREPDRLWPVLVLHLVTFFVAAMVCHGELARRRPPAQYLTGFYLWMSFGGVLGGLFSAVVAPLIFNSVAEYPLLLALACLVGPAIHRASKRPRSPIFNLVLPAAAGALGALAMIQYLRPFASYPQATWQWAGLIGGLVVGTYAAVALFTVRPLLFGLGVGAVLLLLAPSVSLIGDLIYQKRSFFGVSRVTLDHGTWLRPTPDGYLHLFYHGSTLHGAQSLDPAARDMPLAYFHPTSPIGQVFETLGSKISKRPVAVLGLGIGTLAAYGQPQQDMDFFEINPEIEALARNPEYFTYMKDSPARCRTILGDGRLNIARVPDERYSFIILDAFSSDAIPVHLLTREAVRDVYLHKLAPGGLLAFNITNRYLRVEPVLADLAADLGLTARVERDRPDFNIGKSQSLWVIIARDEKDLGPLAHEERWRELRRQPGGKVWTDDYSNVLQIMMWY